MVQTPVKTITLNEFLQLPETKPYSEFIHDKIIQKPMPQGKHSRIQTKLIIAIDKIASNKPQALAFTELRCTFGRRSIVPDVVVLKYDNIPCDENGDIANRVNQAPDFTIEILSPDQNVMKVTNNILYCLNHGCALGWLIDPASKSILVYAPQKQPIFLDNLDNEKEIIPTPNFLADLKLTVGDLFSWLKF